MILKALSDMFCALLDKLIVVSLPNFPGWAMNAFQTAQNYLVQGAGFLQALFGTETYRYLCLLFGFSLAVHVAYQAYDLVMWILKKVPLASIQK